jgi:pSer/pThr/pTyr-binding forkhead associated (FHA) protein
MEGEPLAKVIWEDVATEQRCEYVLTEGATATIGRSSNNDIQIAEQHVSRQHAVIRYRDGVFMISDLGSSNGTFVNDEALEEAFPLFAGDVIRLFVPELHFAAVEEGDAQEAKKTGHLITATKPGGEGSIIVTNGPQEGHIFRLQRREVVIGRAIENASWEIGLLDPSVSRPHARLERQDERWFLYDLGSSNGTGVNGRPVQDAGTRLSDGDTLRLGGSMLLFRAGWDESHSDHQEDDPTVFHDLD